MSKVGQTVQGSEKTLRNGAIGASVWVTKQDGTLGKRFKIHTGPNAARAEPGYQRGEQKQISLAQAKRAYNDYYADTSRWTTAKGRKTALTRDNNYTNNVTLTSTYARNPGKYDYPGVDDGAKKPKPRTEAQKTKLRENLVKARAAKQKGGYQQHQQNQQHQQGGWW